jgi:hypothetical protein
VSRGKPDCPSEHERLHVPSRPAGRGRIVDLRPRPSRRGNGEWSVLVTGPLTERVIMHIPRPIRAVVAVATALIWLATPPTAAQAQGDVYRFWGYYQWSDGGWGFAPTGPAETRPTDGAVEGWRFAVAGAEPRVPRADGDFELICGSADTAEGQKRVAVVIDFGSAADSEDGSQPPAARGACAVVAEDATGSDVLTEAVGDVRLDQSGLVCGIAGYPAQGCGGPVDTPAPMGPEEQVELALPASEDEAAAEDEQDGQDESSRVPVGLLVGIGIVAVVGVAAAVRFRGSKAA